MTQPLGSTQGAAPPGLANRTPGVAAAALARLPVTPFAHLFAPKPPPVGALAPLPNPDLSMVSHAHGERASSSTATAVDPADEAPAKPAKKWAEVDATDPMVRSLHGSAWPYEPIATVPAATAEAAVTSASRVSLEQLWPKVVRRVAWSGDAYSGTARLELGEGALEGATLIIHSDRGAVRVQLEVPPGVDAAEWKERIGRRLHARGLYVAELDVR
jgi:hypothetical protein